MRTRFHEPRSTRTCVRSPISDIMLARYRRIDSALVSTAAYVHIYSYVSDISFHEVSTCFNPMTLRMSNCYVLHLCSQSPLLSYTNMVTRYNSVVLSKPRLVEKYGL